MILNTLDSIIDDIFLELRNSNIAESESLNKAQVEQWITQYRALLIKQDIDKGRDINQAYVQKIEAIKLIQEDFYSSPIISTGKIRYVGDTEIPKTIDFHFIDGIISVTDLLGNEIQLTNKIRAVMQNNRRWSSNEYLAYRGGKKIYIEGPGELEYINVYCILENPSDIDACRLNEEPYPIPVNMIPALKELIFAKEIKIGAASDNKNNSNNDLENISNGKN
jgi:hypothetical protein